jgi:AraC-like DNA-binding protein
MTGPHPLSAGDATLARTEFRTTDPDEAQDFIDHMYSARPESPISWRRSTDLTVSQMSAGGVSSVDFRLSAEQSARSDGTDDVTITTILRGTIEAEWGRRIERFGPGDACLGAWPGGDYGVRFRGLHVRIMTIPSRALADAAGTAPGHTPRPLQFAALAPVSLTGRDQWKRAAGFVDDILADDELASSGLIVGSAARLLAATALAVFPNTRVIEPGPHGHVAATPRALRQAEDYIDAHADADIGIADIAAAAAVTPRALQLAFRRYRDTTPMRHLRDVRLARAHEDLVRGDPSRGDSVTEIAVRWGFGNPGRFAGYYRAAYGRSPSRTLHED